MTATAARIGFITLANRSVSVSDATAASEFGDDARDTKDSPVTSYFNNLDDAEDMLDERMLLVGVKRRRFITHIAGVEDIAGDFDYSEETPTVNIVDSEKAADLDCAVVEIGLDLKTNKTILGSWG